MNKLVLYGYPTFLLLSSAQACATREQLTSLGVSPACSGLLFALGILLLPVWILVLAVWVNESSADDDLLNDYTIDIHIGRGRKKDDSD